MKGEQQVQADFTVRRADWICVVDEGRIIDQGTHASLRAGGGLYRKLCQTPFIDAER